MPEEFIKKKKVKKDALENPQFPGKEKIMEVITVLGLYIVFILCVM